MGGEIKSATSIVGIHVQAIDAAKLQFAASGQVAKSEGQINTTADKMREAFDGAEMICSTMAAYLGKDTGKIRLMANEFEVWDSQVGKK